MADPRAFLKIAKKKEPERNVEERVLDSREVVLPLAREELVAQAARCMNCGIPFCHSPVASTANSAPGGCPLGNLIPEWNELVSRERWAEASQRLLSTNNFPEITGRVCPAPCEASCVLAIEGGAVSIKAIERSIADSIFAQGPLLPVVAQERTGKKVCIVGSGPAGLAAAQELARMGHDVSVFERDDRVGGLLRYGIPDFKLGKGVLDARIAQLVAEGVRFHTGVSIDSARALEDLEHAFDATILAIGARAPRDLPIDGRRLDGVHFAMDYLTRENRRIASDSVPRGDSLDAHNKMVVVIGGGDTGSDCVGTAVRQGARKVTQLELLPRPPEARPNATPWPDWPFILRTSSSHAEGALRDFAVKTFAFRGEGRVTHLELVRLKWSAREAVPVGETFTVECDLALLAMGFTGPERAGDGVFGLPLTDRGAIAVDSRGATSRPGLFAAGDASRGQSLVVWAIADGRRAARGVSDYLHRQR